MEGAENYTFGFKLFGQCGCLLYSLRGTILSDINTYKVIEKCYWSKVLKVDTLWVVFSSETYQSLPQVTGNVQEINFPEIACLVSAATHNVWSISHQKTLDIQVQIWTLREPCVSQFLFICINSFNQFLFLCAYGNLILCKKLALFKEINLSSCTCEI